jgi:hypothetical protein
MYHYVEMKIIAMMPMGNIKHEACPVSPTNVEFQDLDDPLVNRCLGSLLMYSA